MTAARVLWSLLFLVVAVVVAIFMARSIRQEIEDSRAIAERDRDVQREPTPEEQYLYGQQQRYSSTAGLRRPQVDDDDEAPSPADRWSRK